ncbi:MAG: G5 domain-containing protein [Clostridia bacterium]|nr:G5 domain-containing protein [Clostridia bacterium]
MKSNQKTLQKIRKLLSGRAVAVSALVAAVAVMMTYVSMNMRLVTISDGDQSHNVMSMSKDSGWILKAAGLELNENDVVTSEWEFDRGEIVVDRAVDVTISVDGVMRTISMTEGTVADALNKAGVVLGKDDVVSVSQETEISEAITVQVDRVTFEERVETEAVPFGKTSYETSDYNKGESVVVTAGVNGELKKTFTDRLVNGEVVESTLKEEVVTKEPVDEVTAIGTYVKPAFNISNQGGSTPDFKYKQVLYGQATAYTNEGGICGQYTSTGMLAQVGVVAVNPNIIPYGSKLYITTPDGSYVYGYAVAGDTGGFIYSHPDTIVDLFMNTVAECYAFGRRDIVVYVLE